MCLPVSLLRYHLGPTHGPSWMKNGAEKLLGRGDMLFKPIDENHPIRLQGSFISDDDVERLSTLSKSRQKLIMMMPLIQEKYRSQTLMEVWVAQTRVILSLKRPSTRHRDPKPVLR